MYSSLEPQEKKKREHSPADTMALAYWDLFQTPDLHDYTVINLLFKAIQYVKIC